MQFISTPHYTPGRTSPIRLLIIHTAEAPETSTTAENVARYFATTTVQASSHYCVDNNSIVQCVNLDDTAWTAPPANACSINWELAGYASQTPTDWDDDYSRAALELLAAHVAQHCITYNIPAVHVTGEQVRNGRGICGHGDITAAYNVRGGHTDPGKHFPWDAFIQRVTQHINGIPLEQENDNMKNIGICWTDNDGTAHYALLNTHSGFWNEYTIGAAPSGEYNNPIAAAFDTGTFATVSQSHADALRASCILVRRA